MKTKVSKPASTLLSIVSILRITFWEASKNEFRNASLSFRWAVDFAGVVLSRNDDWKGSCSKASMSKSVDTKSLKGVFLFLNTYLIYFSVNFLFYDMLMIS